MNPSSQTCEHEKGDLLVPLSLLKSINHLVIDQLCHEHFVAQCDDDDLVGWFVGAGVLIDVLNLARTGLAQRLVGQAEVR